MIVSSWCLPCSEYRTLALIPRHALTISREDLTPVFNRVITLRELRRARMTAWEANRPMNWPPQKKFFVIVAAKFLTLPSSPPYKLFAFQCSGRFELSLRTRRWSRRSCKVFFRHWERTDPSTNLNGCFHCGNLCWEVTAKLAERADSKLTFVTKVVKITDGRVRVLASTC